MKQILKNAALCIVLSLLVAMFCIPAQAIGDPTNGQTVISSGSVGQGTGKQTTLVNFTASDLCGFEAIGNTSDPIFKSSAAWNANVLYTWLNSAEAETGIRGTLSNPSILQGASTLSVQLLAQYTKATTYKATLRLEGVDKAGAPLSLVATATASSANWQTVTFDISAFVENANLEVPCTVTVLTTSEAEEEEFVLWVHSIYTSSIETYPEYLLPVAAAACGFIVGFALFFVIYRATCKRNRRPRWEER